MQFCIEPMFADNEKKSFSGIAVTVVGAFASNAPLLAMIVGANLRGAPWLLLMCECLSSAPLLGSRLPQTLLLHRLLGSRLGEVLLLFLLLGARLSQTLLLHRLFGSRLGEVLLLFLLLGARLTQTRLLCHFGAFSARVSPRFGAVWCDFPTLRDDFRSGGGIAAEKYLYSRRCGRKPPTHYVY